MKFIHTDGVMSINVAGIEYTADDDGVVTITDETHITAAQANGFVAVEDEQHNDTTGE